MSDGTNSKSWQKFLSELAKEDVEFSTIQHADESTRSQLLQSITTLSSIDRAQVSSTWAKLAASGKASESDSTPSRDPAIPIREAQSSRVADTSIPLRTTPSQPQFDRQQQLVSQQSFGRPEYSAYIPPAAPEYHGNTTPGSGSRSNAYNQSFSGNRSISQPQQAPPPQAPPVLSVPVMNLGISGNDLASLLRTALDRGDCGTALPLASEMLQTDPNGLVYMLNEFLPQLSVEQLKTILGVGVPLGNDASSPAANIGGGGGSPRSASRMQPPIQTFYNTSAGNLAQQDDSMGVEMTTQPTLNGQPLSAGQVLTAHSIQSQYGPRFTATCNGMTLKFPYCVQRGDKIIVRSAVNADRLL